MKVTISDLAIARGGIPVLEGLSFEVPAGRALILRGPNGLGKTTLLRTLSGLQPPLVGQIDPGPEAMAYGAHADGLKATLTVAENLTFWAKVFGKADIAPALDAFRLRDLAARPAATLSAGQKRRLGLARMVVTGRPVWLLDEPTVSLDTQAVEWFAEAVRTHLGQGGCAMIATHIDLRIEADVLDLSPFRAKPAREADDFAEAFL
ncbi:heme exporter protein A [Poseidonocella pacifica]|uniref:Heme exporter protein A n=1 Tax=Poseidonocella pacifica TaxID=871651 RepID=A0A1I0VBJ7_9RHOB|nr:heme ABC exporter ATP-binding protein CcmA [Poseidonocella pacifica]SFA73705.1 heme exporter protein A [Poseidonocella pacifica]